MHFLVRSLSCDFGSLQYDGSSRKTLPIVPKIAPADFWRNLRNRPFSGTESRWRARPRLKQGNPWAQETGSTPDRRRCPGYPGNRSPRRRWQSPGTTSGCRSVSRRADGPVSGSRSSRSECHRRRSRRARHRPARHSSPLDLRPPHIHRRGQADRCDIIRHGAPDRLAVFCVHTNLDAVSQAVERSPGRSGWSSKRCRPLDPPTGRCRSRAWIGPESVPLDAPAPASGTGVDGQATTRVPGSIAGRPAAAACSGSRCRPEAGAG